MQPLSGRFHSSVQYLLSSLAPPHVTDNGYWAFPVNHTSHAHAIEYELWLIQILSLTHGSPTVGWETRSLSVGEFSSPIARLARLLSSYDFLHTLPVSILQPCSSSGIFRQLDGILSSASSVSLQIRFPSVWILSPAALRGIISNLENVRYLRYAGCRFKSVLLFFTFRKNKGTKKVRPKCGYT